MENGAARFVGLSQAPPTGRELRTRSISASISIKTGWNCWNDVNHLICWVYCKKIKMHFIYNTEFSRLSNLFLSHRATLLITMLHKILWTIVRHVFRIEIWNIFKYYNNKIYLYNSSLHSPLNNQSTLKMNFNTLYLFKWTSNILT